MGLEFGDILYEHSLDEDKNPVVTLDPVHVRKTMKSLYAGHSNFSVTKTAEAVQLFKEM